MTETDRNSQIVSVDFDGLPATFSVGDVDDITWRWAPFLLPALLASVRRSCGCHRLSSAAIGCPPSAPEGPHFQLDVQC